MQIALPMERSNGPERPWMRATEPIMRCGPIAGCVAFCLVLQGCAGHIDAALYDRSPDRLQDDQAMQGCAEFSPVSDQDGRGLSLECSSG